MPQTYACRRCGKTYSLREYEEDRFCRDCGTYLMSHSKVPRFSKNIRRVMKNKVSKKGWLPENYKIRKGQMEFIYKATKSVKNKEVFLGSAPCGIGKSLASLLAVLPQLDENKLMICFRTRSQLHIYLKELRALSRNLSAISFYSKQDMCPLQIKGHLSYFDFFEECKRLKDNCKPLTRPYCKFYWNIIKGKKEAEKLALDCAQRVLAPRETVRQMSRRGFCAYEALKRVFPQVNVFLGTYHYVFGSRIRETILKSFGVDLSRVCLIIDEAHNLPTFARKLLSDHLTKNTVERALKETERFKHESLPLVREHLNVLNEEVFQRARQTLKSEELRQLNPQEISDLFLDQGGVSGFEVAETIQDYGEYVREKRLELGSESILSYNYRVGEFMENFFEKDGMAYIHLIERDQKDRINLDVRSFDGREITDPVLRQVQGSILMSGFLSPPKVYRDLTLYEPSNACLEEFDSPFPPENRLILVARGVSSEFKKRTNEMLSKISEYIEAISNANEGNIGVFFTSYGLMHKILPLMAIKRNKIVERHTTKRNEVVQQLTRSSDNALLGVMGGKFSEGIDFPNDALTCVVAVGLPYATWGVYQKALINYLEHEFPENGRTYAYLAPAILRLIQTCGRVHRSADDKGCIVLLDERITQESTRQQLPKYFQKEMMTVQSPIDCAKRIIDFWEEESSYGQNGIYM